MRLIHIQIFRWQLFKSTLGFGELTEFGTVVRYDRRHVYYLYAMTKTQQIATRKRKFNNYRAVTCDLTWIKLFRFPSALRTPFELNTTLRCASMVAFELLTSMSQPCLFGTVPSLLIAFMIYSEACFADIKYLLMQGDRILQSPEHHKAKRMNSELKLLEQYKEATVLHRGVIRYYLPFHQSIVLYSIWWFIRFSLMDNLAELVSFTNMITITLYAMCICISLFVIEKVTSIYFESDQLMILWHYFSVRWNQFFVRYATADYGSCRSLNHACHFLLLGSEDSFEYDGSEWYNLSNWMVSIPTQRTTFRVAYDDAIAATISSDRERPHQNEFGKFRSRKQIVFVIVRTAAKHPK